MEDKEILQQILLELREVKQDVKELKELKTIVEDGFKQTREELVTAIEAVGKQIDDIELVTARNCYRLEVLDCKKKA